MAMQVGRMATMNLADPELELVDPTPNVHMLFIHFDKLFFWTKLASRAVVRWSKRMYSCAGICAYEGGRGGLCDIALSEPLLKLRPRKDLVETLLHEMIHAFLFITCMDQDRDGHGPNFKAHMYRINQAAGLNISIYHDFHDEVKLYLTHWWRCNGPCQRTAPYFGIVQRSCNRAPGPSDYWFERHRRVCGGTFVKIREPEKKKPGKQAENQKNAKAKVNNTKTNVTMKSNGDITKYITTTTVNGTANKVLHDTSNIKTNNNPSFIIGKKHVTFNPTVTEVPKTSPVFKDTGNSIIDKPLTDFRNVTEHVRNIWANKQIPTVANVTVPKKPITNDSVNKPSVSKPGIPIASSSSNSSVNKINPNKHKADSTDIHSPPAKVKKMDDYIKNLYGSDFSLTKDQNSTKLVAVKLVDCPICGEKVDDKEINRHLDECLNKDIIQELSQGNIQEIPSIPAFKGTEGTNNKNTETNNNVLSSNKERRKTESQATLQNINMDNVKSLTNQMMNKTTDNIPYQKPTLASIRKSDNFITADRGDDIKIKIEPHIEAGPSNTVTADRSNKIKIEAGPSNIKQEPGTSKEIESSNQICPCCGNKSDKPIIEHLDECLVFFNNNATIPEEGGNISIMSDTIVIDDDEDDIFDETMKLNATGTKLPCPCCMKMIEHADMNDHLDVCLGLDTK
ncbi:DNA-dependent metalloprotease SPRTN [Anticarsia gemmatalis]|uniref:DNA-dependent metalloprotease SPRTN n=1 Tax=Anticarsia gemmatalis TaxID=129554 RepID=UPI003F7778D9